MPRRCVELRQQRPALDLGDESLVDTDYDDETIVELEVEGATYPQGTISDGVSEIIGFSTIDIVSSHTHSLMGVESSIDTNRVAQSWWLTIPMKDNIA